MMKLFHGLAFATVAFVALSGCDSKPAEPAPAAEPAAEVAAAPPPTPPPLDAATALAAIDQKTLCGLFARAVSDAQTKVAKSDCVVGPDGVITTKDKSSSLGVSIVEATSVVQLTPENASPRAVADAEHGTFSNIGIVFIGKAPASGLCMSFSYLAPDASSNSLFLMTDPNVDPVRLNVKMLPDVATFTYSEPVVPANQIGAFALTRREPGLEVKSVTFRPC